MDEPELDPAEPLRYKRELRLQSLGYFERDLLQAKTEKYILGIKVWERDDSSWPLSTCPRAAGFAGVYLPDEVPALYPEDCPDETCCACVLREMVFTMDHTPEAMKLRDRMVKRGLTPPPLEPEPKPWTEERRAQAFASAEQELKTAPERDKPVWRFLMGLFSKK